MLPNEGQPAEILAVGGDDQTGTILEPLPDSLVVQVRDRFGSPVSGIRIAWSAADGGQVSPSSSVTDAGGRASTERVLGAEPGTYGTTATTEMLPDDAASFTTIAVAAKLVLVTQPSSTGASGEPFAQQPVLQLQDAEGNASSRADVPVTVQIASGQGSLQGTTTQTSDGSGVVTFTDLAIVGAPGARTLIFAASGYASAISSPVSLGVGEPASITAAAGQGQSATAGTAVATAPTVLVRDAGGTPLAGVEVTFTVTSGGGSITGAKPVTGVDGKASVGRWNLGPTTGANTLTAGIAAPDVSGNPVTFTATATAGGASADRSTINASPKSIVASQGSSASTITIVVKDQLGNALANQTVTLTATGSGNSLSQPSPTDATGTTLATLSATGAGEHRVTAIAAGVELGGVTITVTPAAPAAARTVTQVPGGTAGEPTEITLNLKDQFGNAVSGAKAQIAIAVTGANSKSSLGVQETGGGAYAATYTPTATGTDQVDVRVGGTPVPGSPFTSDVVAGPGDPAHTTADIPEGSLFFPLQIVVHVADKEGNPVGHGGDQVSIVIDNTNTLTVVDRGDGSYAASWTPLTTGTFKVNIALNGTAIAGSPFSLRVRTFR